MDSQGSPQPVMCEVCGTYFETRRGLSSHARLHLRQLGVTLSENSGAPIELLYQLIQERDGCLPLFKSASSVFGPTSDIKTTQLESSIPSVQDDSYTSYSSPVRVVTSPQKVDHQGSPARLKESTTSILPSSPSSLRLFESSNSSFVEQQITTKPLWAPLETDAPITLDTNQEVHVCQLCGSWFETRKGLASHARVHLRQIGVSDGDVKGSPVDFLYKIMEEEDLKPLTAQKQLTSIRPSSKRSAELSSAQASAHSKRPRASAPLSPGPPTLSPAPNQPHPLFSSTPLYLSPMSPPSNKAPKAKKGFRLAVDPLLRKPKPEPVEMELSIHPQASSMGTNSPLQKSPGAVVHAKSLQSAIVSPPTVLCDYCGQLFDTRKALSCHARAHLRQLGLSWSIKTSPIDLLKEVMEQGKKLGQDSTSPSKKPQGSVSSAEPASNTCTSPVDFSVKEKNTYNKPSHADTSCELCGFDFENRKALASHARAHLRQLGLTEWKTDGATSPIELLSELIRKDPTRVSEITKRYRVGDLYIKKAQRLAGSPSLSTDSENSSGLRQHDHRANRENVSAGTSRHSQGHTRTMNAHSNVRSPRGLHPPKHSITPAGTVNQDNSSHQPPRSGSIPALLPKPPLTPLVKLVGKMYTLKCRFCEEVFHGPLSVQEQWITHLQKHILSLGYKGKESPPAAAAVTAPALVDPVAV